VPEQVLASWSFDPWLLLLLAGMAGLYLRGALVWPRADLRTGEDAHRRGFARRPGFALQRGFAVYRALSLRRGCTPARTASYLGGLLAIWLALASPLESFAPLMLSAHMAQHMLLTMVAAPLILMGEPFLPLLRGLPATIRREWLGPFIASRGLRRTARWLVHPVVAWITFNLVFIAWHVPALYELALRDPAWHRAEHGSLLAVAILFWWPVVVPAPSRAWWPRWAMVPYLLAADIVNTVIAASFAFAPGVIYAAYTATAPALGIDALRDQAAAGALMWVPGSIAYLVPAAVILLKLMRPKALRRPVTEQSVPTNAAHSAPAVARDAIHAIHAIHAIDARGSRGESRRESRRALALPQLPPAGMVPQSRHRSHADARRFDLLRVPILGPLMARRGVRLALRGLMLLLALLIVIDGFAGPREAPMNLAGTLPWTHWRGIAVLLLLIGGNLLCMTCPFVLPRMLAEQWRRRRERGVVLGSVLGALPAAVASLHARSRRWPPALRNKWTAVALVAAWLVVYEAFDLWASPLATAWVIVAYFGAAFVVDSVTTGGAFCKWVCPLGQFHFAQSTLSPLTVAARDPATCTRCTTHDCLRGNESQRGCGLDLLIPRKIGNLDCTFCLDCADACPHDNVGVLTHSIAGELRSDRWRSSLGRLSRRPDLATLLLVLSAGAIANAAGMTEPLLRLMASVADSLSWPRSAAAVVVVMALLVAPVALVMIASIIAQGRAWRESYATIAISTVPLGAAVWLVHFAFHFVTSWQTAGPVIVRAAGDLGLMAGEPAWSSACCSHAPSWLMPANLLALSLGTSLSLWTLARRGHPSTMRLNSVGMSSPVAPPTDQRIPTTHVPWRAWLPGAIVIVALWAAAAWVFFQPMDMRGTLGFEVVP